MQSRLDSLVEAVCNIGTGFVLALCVTYWVLPLWGLEPNGRAAIEITLLYTVISIARSWVWRRAFNWFHCRPSE
jgi:hypothetical protein